MICIKLRIIKVDKENKEKHNNFEIILIISAKLPCVTCGGFSQITYTFFSSISKNYISQSKKYIFPFSALQKKKKKIFKYYYNEVHPPLSKKNSHLSEIF